MKRNLSLLPFFITSYFFSSAFLFKPNIKIITCGQNAQYYGNITKEKEQEILNDYPWIFDSKSGQLYSYNQIKNTIKPVKSEIVNGYEYIYKKNYVLGEKLYVQQIDRDLETNEIFKYEAILDFKNLKVSWFQDGEENASVSVCKEISLPKGLQISKNQSQDYTTTIRYSDFIDAVQEKKISRVLISPDNGTAQVIGEDG